MFNVFQMLENAGIVSSEKRDRGLFNFQFFRQLLLCLVLPVHLSGMEQKVAKVRSDYNYTNPLLIAAKEGNTSKLLELLDKEKYDVDLTEEEDECSAIHLAAMKGHKDIVNILLEKGANAERCAEISKIIDGELERDCFHPLRLAAKNDHDEVAMLLLEKNEGILEDSAH